MGYSAKEIFYTIQGEGVHSGRPAVFLRFAGCNLWSGHEVDRVNAICQFCDTDFIGINGIGGGKFSNAKDLARTVSEKWMGGNKKKFVVCTGGEPLLQLDKELIDALHCFNFEIAVETNGTIEVPGGIDWICVSPKAGSKWIQRKGNELKLVYPQLGLLPESIVEVDFDHFLLQPMDSENIKGNTADVVRFCMANPKWRVSLQTHKILGIA